MQWMCQLLLSKIVCCVSFGICNLVDGVMHAYSVILWSAHHAVLIKVRTQVYNIHKHVSQYSVFGNVTILVTFYSCYN